MDYFSPSLTYTLLKDVMRAVFNRKKVTPEEKIRSREKWKTPFEEEILRNFRTQVRKDVIIRDVKRYDSYPNIEERKRGISPWFRLALLDTYHDGILVWLSHEELVEVGDQRFRKADYENGERGKYKTMLCGRIPFYLIESVDFEGDEYYCFPHIFCHFSIKGMPYESLDHYVEHQPPDTPPFYVKITSQKSVKKETKKAGIKPF